MKKHIIIINTILIFSLLLSIRCQAYTPVSEEMREYIKGEGAANIRGIYDFPPELLPENIPELFIIPVPPELEKIILVGKSEEGDYYNFGKVEFSGFLNIAKTDIFYDESDGLIYLYSQLPSKAFSFMANYSWDEEKNALLLLEEWSEDPSADAVIEVERLLEEGKIEEADKELASIFYPHNYYNPDEMSVKFLRSAHKYAIKEYREGSNDSWVLIMKAINESSILTHRWPFEFSSKEDYKQSNYEKFMDYKEFIVIINDYGFLMEQAGKEENAIYVLNYVLTLSPERTVAHLNLADALYKSGKSEEAKKYYSSYIELMKKDGNEKEIPARVYERVK